MTLVSHLILERALERQLRPSTVRSYQTLLGRLGLLEREVDTVTREECITLLWERVENINTRRATTIALRSVLPVCAGIKIPKGVARRVVLPSEDELRMALMFTPHEVRGLAMMFAGCRVGEAAALTARDVRGDQLTIDKQINETTRKLAPVKSNEDSITIPIWLAERISTLEGTEQPASIRESLRRAGKKAGIELSPHLLRKWYITRLIEAGVPLELVRRQARHSDISVTLKHYQAFDEKQIHDVLG